MLKTRLAPVALVAAVAALVVLLCSAAAPAADLESKLNAKEAKLSEVHEREGVLTTTISRYRERIERLTGEVAVLRSQEAEVQSRLDAKQAELDGAVAELDVGKKHLAVVRAQLKRALVSLRERLVAMYETGTPDILSVLVEAGGYDELVNRTEYLNRIHGLDEAVVTRVRDLRDQVKRTVARLRVRQGPDRIGPRRDRRRRAGPGERPRGRPAAAGAAGLRPPHPRGGAAEGEQRRGRPGGLGGRDPGRTRRHPQRHRLGAASRRADPLRVGSAHLAGRRPGRLRLRHALGQHARGDRHRRPGRDPDPSRGLRLGRPGAVRSRKRRLRQLHLPRPRRGLADLLRPPVLLCGHLGRASRRAT